MPHCRSSCGHTTSRQQRCSSVSSLHHETSCTGRGATTAWDSPKPAGSLTDARARPHWESEPAALLSRDRRTTDPQWCSNTLFVAGLLSPRHGTEHLQAAAAATQRQRTQALCGTRTQRTTAVFDTQKTALLFALPPRSAPVCSGRAGPAEPSFLAASRVARLHLMPALATFVPATPLHSRAFRWQAPTVHLGAPLDDGSRANGASPGIVNLSQVLHATKLATVA